MVIFVRIAGLWRVLKNLGNVGRQAMTIPRESSGRTQRPIRLVYQVISLLCARILA